LQDGDYRRAYALTSEESRRRRTAEKFEKSARESSIVYDFNRARLELSGEDKATLSLPHEEDPAWSEMTLVREKGQWRIVFLNGLPWAPQP
jgi:hypothetical protein